MKAVCIVPIADANNVLSYSSGKERLPELEDGATGFPPRDDDGGGSGGGGGGGDTGLDQENFVGFIKIYIIKKIYFTKTII